jgi:hypothetical protein
MNGMNDLWRKHVYNWKIKSCIHANVFFTLEIIKIIKVIAIIMSNFTLTQCEAVK